MLQTKRYILLIGVRLCAATASEMEETAEFDFDEAGHKAMTDWLSGKYKNKKKNMAGLGELYIQKRRNLPASYFNLTCREIIFL